MLLKLFGKITPHLRSGRELFGSIKPPLVISHQFQCTLQLNESVEKWIDTLADDKQKRVRHIQNEVSVRSLSDFCFGFMQIK